jgi:hypothetical protein
MQLDLIDDPHSARFFLAHLLDMWGNAFLNWVFPIVHWGEGGWHSIDLWAVPLALYLFYWSGKRFLRRRSTRTIGETELRARSRVDSGPK